MALKDGLLHWWELDTTAWLDSHGSWHLTNRTAVSINSTGAPDGGPAAVFNGSHYLNRTAVAWDGSGAARSIQTWAQYSSLSEAGNWLYNHRGRTSEYVLHQINFSTVFGSVCRASFSDGTAYVGINNASTTAGTWYHILATTNGTDRHRIYVNGALAGEDTTLLDGTILIGAQPLAIGTQAWDVTYTPSRHRGLACLAAVWERELSETEGVKLYNGGTMRRYAALESKSIVASLRRAHAGIRGMRA